jgi:hypothetical protein
LLKKKKRDTAKRVSGDDKSSPHRRSAISGQMRRSRIIPDSPDNLFSATC